MRYEVILFDADDTLFDFNQAEEAALEKAMRNFLRDYQKEFHLSTYRQINKKIWEEFEQGLITADKLKVERFRRLFEQLQLQLEIETFSIYYLDCLAECAVLIEGAAELLAELSEYKLALITNGLARVQHSRLQRSGLVNFFHSIIISEEVGVTKPNVGIFLYAMEKLNHLDKKSVIIVGDSLTSDIQGGINFGIDTCWYNPTKKVNTSGIKPTYEIHDLWELKELLTART